MFIPTFFAVPVVIFVLKLVLCDLDLVVLHNNDMHSRFEETSRQSGTCQNSERNKTCVGGFARTAHEIRRFRKLAQTGQGSEVLFLNGGDTFIGTTWFTLFKSNISSKFVNILEPDAICLGNHEFDYGIKTLVEFLNNLNCPIVGANMDFSLEPDITKVKKSVVLEKQGKKIGIIGYTTPETIFKAVPGETIFSDEVASIRKESQRLNDQGVKIIFALGHSGYLIDKKIAMEVPLVDAVIGGHSHTFLWSGQQPDIETVEDLYPKVIRQSSGKEVPVVQAYAYTKYLGVLNLKFNDNGDLIKFYGQPILLKNNIPQEKDVLDLLEVYRPRIIAINKKIVGQSRSVLEQSNCRMEECVFGNLVADAFASYRKSKYPAINLIGLQNGGSIRSTIKPGPNGDVSFGELLTALPYNNQLVTFKLNGSDLIKSLEIGISTDEESMRGGFLQVSGIKVVFDILKPPMSRVVSIKVKCQNSLNDIYEDVNLSKMYWITTNNFLTDGGDSHYIFAKHSSEKSVGDLEDVNVVEWYFNKFSPVEPIIEGRITIKNGHTLTTSIIFRTTIIMPSIVCMSNLLSE